MTQTTTPNPAASAVNSAEKPEWADLHQRAVSKEIEFSDLPLLAPVRHQYQDKSIFLTQYLSAAGLSNSEFAKDFENRASQQTGLLIFHEDQVPLPAAMIRFYDTDSLSLTIKMALLLLQAEQQTLITSVITELGKRQKKYANMRKISATVCPASDATEIAILEQCGYEKEVTFPNYFYIRGASHDAQIWSLFL